MAAIRAGRCYDSIGGVSPRSSVAGSSTWCWSCSVEPVSTAAVGRSCSSPPPGCSHPQSCQLGIAGLRCTTPPSITDLAVGPLVLSSPATAATMLYGMKHSFYSWSTSNKQVVAATAKVVHS
uniref:(northern house mosquito) hypothetical protein n=1 Tax=Culex pipiens TaxID=7175 RepID=A0A8D8CRF7_CULPI